MSKSTAVTKPTLPDFPVKDLFAQHSVDLSAFEGLTASDLAQINEGVMPMVTVPENFHGELRLWQMPRVKALSPLAQDPPEDAVPGDIVSDQDVLWSIKDKNAKPLRFVVAHVHLLYKKFPPVGSSDYIQTVNEATYVKHVPAEQKRGQAGVPPLWNKVYAFVLIDEECRVHLLEMYKSQRIMGKKLQDRIRGFRTLHQYMIEAKSEQQSNDKGKWYTITASPNYELEVPARMTAAAQLVGAAFDAFFKERIQSELEYHAKTSGEAALLSAPRGQVIDAADDAFAASDDGSFDGDM